MLSVTRVNERLNAKALMLRTRAPMWDGPLPKRVAELHDEVSGASRVTRRPKTSKELL